MLLSLFLLVAILWFICILGLVRPQVLLESQGGCRTGDYFVLLTRRRLVWRHQRCCCAERLALAELEGMQAAESVC